MIQLALIGGGGPADEFVWLAPRLVGASFQAVAGSSLDESRSAAQRLGAPIVAASLDELLEKHAEAFEAVVIRAAGDARARLAQQAASSGKHVLVGTPPARSTAEVDALIEACRSRGVCLMLEQHLRLLPALEAVKEAVVAGKLGEPGLLRIHRWQPREPGAKSRSSNLYDGSPKPSTRRDCGESTGSEARRTLASQGSRDLQTGSETDEGPLLDRIAGEIDLANWLFDAPPREVYAVRPSPGDGRSGTPGYVQVHLGFRGGGMALIDYAASLPPGASYFSLSLIGSTGAAYADDHHNMQLLYRGGEPSAINTQQGYLHVLRQMQQFVRCVQQHLEPTITGADGRRAIQVAEAVIESLAHGRAVHRRGDRYELV